jgi:hypothetical protein
MDIEPVDALINPVAGYQLQPQYESRRGDPTVGLVDLVSEAVSYGIGNAAQLGTTVDEKLVGLHDLEVAKRSFQPP